MVFGSVALLTAVTDGAVVTHRQMAAVSWLVALESSKAEISQTQKE